MKFFAPLFLFLLALSSETPADENLKICHGYGCVAEADIRYDETRLAEIRRLLASTTDAASERERLSEAIGQLYAWAGEQSDIKNDKGGNFADGGQPGKMDCIDHSTSTTRLLNMLEARHLLRWHRTSVPELRHWLFFPAHYTAVIEETGSGARFAVDAWFVDNGRPAVILPLEEWKKGAGPNV